MTAVTTVTKVTAVTQYRARFVVVNTVFLMLSVGAASIAFWPIYRDNAIIVLVVSATVAGSAIAILGARFRWSFLTMLAVTLGVFVTIGVPLAVPSAAIFGVFPSLDGFRQLAVGMALGWKQLVTITVPVGAYQGLLVPALIIVLVAVVSSLSAALRSRFGGVGAAGAPLVLFAAIALGPESESSPVPIALATVGLSVLWLAWRRQFFRGQAMAVLAGATGSSPRAFSAFRAVVASTVVLAIAGGVGVVAVALFPLESEPRVLRSAVELPFTPQNYVSPLAGFRQYLQPGRAQEIVFTAEGLIDGDRVRLATLNSYNGVVFSVGGVDTQLEADAFTRVAFQFDQSALDGPRASISVQIGAYSGVWLPTIGQLESVSFSGENSAALRDSFFYNDGSGTAAVIQELGPGDSYRLEVVRPRTPTAGALAQLTPGSQTVPQALVPAELDRSLARYTIGAATPGERLTAMLAGLRSEGYVSHGISADEPASRSGHSADRVSQLLTDQPMVGDAEQYATVAAIMAQQLGFPARVVFGFIPEVTPGSSVDVRGEHVSAWIEVGTAEFGWVALDAVPPVRPIPERAPDVPQAVSRPQPVIPPPAEAPNNTVEATPPQNTQDENQTENPWLAIALRIARIAGGVLSVAAVLAMPLAVVVLLKKRRTHRRRHAATPRARMVGGWLEFTDTAVDHGLLPAHSSTRREFAQLIGGAKATVLAAVVDRAVFAPSETTAVDAEKVWRAVTELGKELRVGLTRRERLRGAVSLRSLRPSLLTRAQRIEEQRRDV